MRTDRIVDHAAGLFARKGLTNPSLRHTAFAGEFAKTGLLQHFPTKRSLIGAATQISRRYVAEAIVRARAVPPGRERDLAVVQCAVDFAMAWPGIAALGQSMVVSRTLDAEMERQGFALMPVLGLDREDVDRARVADVVCAFAGLSAASQQLDAADQSDRLRDEWRDLVVATTMRTLGHREPRLVSS